VYLGVRFINLPAFAPITSPDDSDCTRPVRESHGHYLISNFANTVEPLFLKVMLKTG
jgi:hypothetical protein